MSQKARVSGEIYDATGNPVARAKVVATLVGDDYFPGGRQIVTAIVDAVTDSLGRWELDLLVNAEGENKTTSWTIVTFGRDNVQESERRGLFIASSSPIEMDDLVQHSAANLAASRSADLSALFRADSLQEYTAMPEALRRSTDMLFIKPSGGA